MTGTFRKFFVITVLLLVLAVVGMVWYMGWLNIQLNGSQTKLNTFETTTTPPALEYAISPNYKPMFGELVSPDGEWYFAGERYFGKEPFSRGLLWALEFINLKGGGSRYIYEDWFERPEDGSYGSTFRTGRPIGWSADGNAVYLAYVDPLREKNPLLPKELSGYWDKPSIVRRISLSAKNFNNVSYQNVAPASRQGGIVLDLLPKEDRALWFIPVSQFNQYNQFKPLDDFEDLTPEYETAELVYFRPSDGGNARTIAELKLPGGSPSSTSYSVTSASLDQDPNAERVAYVVHQPGKNDEAYIYTSTTTTTSTILLDLKPYRDVILKNRISEPYQLIVEKTAMTLPGGLFLVVVGANQEIMFIRFNDFGKGYSPMLSKDGLL